MSYLHDVPVIIIVFDNSHGETCELVMSFLFMFEKIDQATWEVVRIQQSELCEFPAS